MNVDDRVRHKKYGLGTVIAVYPKTSAARVRYDSGHESVNAEKRLQVLTAGQGVGVEAQSAPPRAAKRRGTGTTDVDYDLLERARAHVASENKDADRVDPKVYGNRVYCEVWRGGSAQNVFYEERS